MKSNFTLLFLLVFSFISSQKIDGQIMKAPDGQGEYIFNESKNPCLTDEQRVLVKSEIKNGILQLSNQNKLNFNGANRGSHPLFIWPIQKAAGVTYNDVWAISGYMDHNAGFPNQLTDYNCGTKTYDTAAGYNHLGVDIFTWPFSWKMMDNNEVEIIAGASGQIIAKGGSQFDRSCNFNSNTWNAVYVQHSDGSVALYGHMKQNSLTTKNVGDMVSTGEFLGIVGSSGNSTGPHLHFEVYSEIEWNGTGQDVLVDPYSGSCNNLNADSWWQSQKPYVDPNINAALTHSAAPVFPTCPTTEITNESNQFEPNQMIFFAAYLRDQIAGSTINLEIIQPNNTVFEAWSYTFTVNYSASYVYWNNNTFSIPGEWKWRVTYQGQTVTHNFNVGTLSVGEEDFNSTSIYPNPIKNLVTISSNSVVEKATITDMLGKTINVINSNSVEGIKELNLETLSNGMYFLTLEGDSNQKKTIKLIKK